MFEEIPRKPGGFAGLAARRFVLGPFIIGGGVLLCTVGGSAALAATVITASTIGIDELPPHKTHHPAAGSTTTQSRIERVAGSSASRGAATRKSGASAEAPKPRPTKSPSTGAAGTLPGTGPTAKPTVSTAWASATRTNGNAVVYIFGYDHAAGRIKFNYAVVQPGAASDGGDLYVVNDPTQYSAGLAADLQIASGGTVCPPAGSSCTPDELIKAADAGLFAQVAIDVDGNLKLVTEKGAPAKAASSQPAPSSPSGSGSAPSASPSPGAASMSAPAPG
jgi:hypothetical protein